MNSLHSQSFFAILVASTAYGAFAAKPAAKPRPTQAGPSTTHTSQPGPGSNGQHLALLGHDSSTLSSPSNSRNATPERQRPGSEPGGFVPLHHEETHGKWPTHVLVAAKKHGEQVSITQRSMRKSTQEHQAELAKHTEKLNSYEDFQRLHVKSPADLRKPGIKAEHDARFLALAQQSMRTNSAAQRIDLQRAGLRHSGKEVDAAFKTVGLPGQKETPLDQRGSWE